MCPTLLTTPVNLLSRTMRSGSHIIEQNSAPLLQQQLLLQLRLRLRLLLLLLLLLVLVLVLVLVLILVLVLVLLRRLLLLLQVLLLTFALLLFMVTCFYKLSCHVGFSRRSRNPTRISSPHVMYVMSACADTSYNKRS